MRRFRDHDLDPAFRAVGAQLPLHAVFFFDGHEGLPERIKGGRSAGGVAGRVSGRGEVDPHKEVAVVLGVELLAFQDVAALFQQESGHGVDEAPCFRAVEGQNVFSGAAVQDMSKYAIRSNNSRSLICDSA